MEYRKFGNTALEVSTIGFGAWAIGGAAEVGGIPIGWGQADDAVSTAAIHAALNAGINFFDTADFYGLGHSEVLLGKALAQQKEVWIATKVGQRVGTDGKIEINYSKAYIIEACEKSLQRLGRGTIDFYQLHVARLPHLQQGECIEAMEALQQAGKIRYWGLSLNTFAPEPEAQFLLEAAKGQGFQLVLNLINQKALPIIAQAAAQGYGIIARMPLQFGLLSGKFAPGTKFAANDHRAGRLTPAIVEQCMDLLRADIVPLARQYGTHLAGMALSFVLNTPGVSTVIPGIRTPDQVKRNTSGLVQLSPTDYAYLTGLFAGRWQQVWQLVQQQG
jgi:aryl-alcohol dehydrogenase-like predicted oxidoreductase